MRHISQSICITAIAVGICTLWITHSIENVVWIIGVKKTPTLTGWRIGDANHDGAVTILDALLVAQCSAGLATSCVCSVERDVNKDGKCDINDALKIAQYSAGLIPGF